jgi:hypothetical protein
LREERDGARSAVTLTWELGQEREERRGGRGMMLEISVLMEMEGVTIGPINENRI